MKAWRYVATPGRLLVPALVVSCLPFVLLCFFCFPVADDFVFAGRLSQHDLLGAQAAWYREWSGKYTGSLCISLFLWCFGLEGAYWLAPLLLIAATWAAILLAVRAAGARGRPLLLAAAVLGVWFLAGVRSPHETIYWLTAGYEYQVANVCALLLLALLLWRPVSRAGRLANAGAAGLVAFAAVGATETMMFALVVVAASWGLARILARELPTLRQVAVTLAVAAGATLMLLAPGNDVRSQFFPGAHRLVPSLVSATTRGLAHAAGWAVHPALLGSSLLFLGLAPWLARRRSRLGPGALGPLALLWLLGLVCACHFPAYWAMGAKPPGRALGNVWVVFLAGWFTLVLPSAAQALRRAGIDPRHPRLADLGRSLLVVGLLVSSNVRVALADALLGGALRHRSEQIERAAVVAEARRAGAEELVLAPLRSRPRTIWIDDLSADAADWRNVAYAQWYGLGRVRVAPAPGGR